MDASSSPAVLMRACCGISNPSKGCRTSALLAGTQSTCFTSIKLQTLTLKLQVLTLRTHNRIGAIQTAFLSTGNTLITLSRNEGLSLYHFPTLSLRARLTPSILAVHAGQPQRPHFTCFAITPNRMHIVAATTSNVAYVWHLPSESMVEQITLPTRCATRAHAYGILQPLMPYSSIEISEPESSRLGALFFQRCLPYSCFTGVTGTKVQNTDAEFAATACLGEDGGINEASMLLAKPLCY